MRGQVRETALHGGFQIVPRRREALHHGKQHFTRNAFATVIQRRVQHGIVRRAIGISRKEAGPDFRSDRRAHSGVEWIFKCTHALDRHTTSQVPAAATVFVPHVVDVIQPGARKVRRLQLPIALLDHVEPDELELEIIVRRGHGRHWIVKGKIQPLHLALGREAESAADGFPQPATMDAGKKGDLRGESAVHVVNKTYFLNNKIILLTKHDFLREWLHDSSPEEAERRLYSAP